MAASWYGPDFSDHLVKIVGSPDFSVFECLLLGKATILELTRPLSVKSAIAIRNANHYHLAYD